MLYLRFVFYVFRILQLVTLNRCFSHKVSEAHFLYQCRRYERMGATIGEGTILIDCKLSGSTKGDKFFIGKNCTLTGVTLLAHDASPTLFFPELNHLSPPYLSGARSSYRRQITVGDNVFIGWGTIVLPGIVIGSNVVVGAGSVVTKSVPDGSIVAGNPARIVKSIDEYKEQYTNLLREFPERF